MVDEIKNVLVKQWETLADHSRKLDEVKGKQKEMSGSNKSGGTYAGVVGSSGIKVAGLKKPIIAEKIALTGSSGTTGEKLLKEIKSKIRPSEIGFKPNKVYANRDNKVIIESKDNCFEKFRNLNTLKNMKVAVTQLGKMNPRVTIYNVPADIEKDRLAAEIIEQNRLTDDIAEGQELMIKPVYKFGPREKHFTHWVVEVNPSTRKRLLSMRTLFLGWHSCNVEDKIHLTKCYNYQGFGHTASKCNQKSACGYCAEEHDSRQCRNKDIPERQKCILCTKVGIEDNKHRPRDGRCAAYKRRMEVFVANIDFGDDDDDDDQRS